MKNPTAKKVKMNIPTYVPKPAHELPMFFENKPYQGASGRIYPVPYCDGISDDISDVNYDVYVLENEYIKTEVLPELGGKILSGYDKTADYDFIYKNEVVKPALVGIAGPWISGGIEFNWPQHHRPTTYMPLEAALEENADGSKTVWTGETDPLYRMKGMVGVTLDKGRSYIKAKVRIYNRTDVPQQFMWWANLAVSVNDDYRTVFPPDVEWVNDHDRRAILEWPIAKGVYHTARPFNYGEGTDISKYGNVIVPSSFLVSQDQSDMDFLAGYDDSINKGIVTVADHHISPGKKLWTWGKGDFGDMWCSNLTDKNGPYIELMTGVFTDNQPDFTWIMPSEYREFEQYWYPVKEIGDVKCATIDAALNLEKQDGGVFIGFNVTGTFNNAKIMLTSGDEILFKDTANLDPTTAYKKLIDTVTDTTDLTLTLLDKNGEVLVQYTQYKRGQKKPIEVRKPVLRPSEIENQEELYLNGYHLEQYKQHNYKAEDYYLEGLKRDEFDSRCNVGMARLSLKNGNFKEAVEYASKAIKRLTMRNQHPADTEAFYIKGIALKYLGEIDSAYAELYKSAWSRNFAPSAYLELAQIDCKKGNYSEALEKLDTAISMNTKNTKALVLKAAIARILGDTKFAKELINYIRDYDLLDLSPIIEGSHYLNLEGEIKQFMRKHECFIDAAMGYIEAGLYESALYALNKADQNHPLINYYKAYCLTKLGSDATSEIKKADSFDTGYCFPSRLMDIIVLENAISVSPDGANAYYYLGCLNYDKFNYDKAIGLFEGCIAKDSTHAKAYRNLSFLYFEKKQDFARARECMEIALKYRSFDPRLLLEYEQLLKNINVEPNERLAVYDKYSELLAQRDDCYLDKIIITSTLGEYKKAIDMAAVKRFHIYEGGEGKLTKQHAWMYVLYANELVNEGKLKEAEEAYLNGINMPKSYGEAKTYFNQEAHIFYYLAKLHKSLGEDFEEDLEKAAENKSAVSEISLFRALALKELGRDEKADAVLDEMIEVADNMIKNSDLRGYYGVGSPTPMPFENDIVKQNTLDGNVLLAYAYFGKGQKANATKYINKAASISPYDFRIHAFKKIKETI